MNARLETNSVPSNVNMQKAVYRAEQSMIDAAGVIHDLGNLIQIASSAITIIGRNPEMPARHAGPMLSRARASLAQAGDIVRQQLGHVSKQAVTSGRVSIEDCLRKVSLLAGDLLSPDFTLDTGIEGDLPRVECDSLALQSAILNLVLNARDATDGIGTVRILARRLNEGPAAPGVLISVSDNGHGMAPATIARAFTPFFTTKPGGHGGVGLSMVKRFVEDAGGEIAIESRVEAGTTVSLTLPAALQRVREGSKLHPEIRPADTERTTTMKLYFAPGACSLACRISLHEAGLPADFERVDLKSKLTESGFDFEAINPKGYVPFLVLDNGNAVSEASAVLALIADHQPELGARGPLAPIRLIETLSYLSSELHTAFKPFFHDGSESEKAAARATVARRLEVATDHVRELYLFGSHFSVADALLFVMMRWAKAFDVPMAPNLHGYYERIAERPAVRTSLAEEGLA